MVVGVKTEMNILIISDIHGDVENLLSYLDKIKELKFDVIVSPGDFTDVDTPGGFTQEDIAKLILKEFKSLGKPVLCVPGNVDTRGVLGVLEEEDVSVHGKGRVVGSVGFYGYGGAKTPFKTNIEPNEEELKIGLSNAWKDVKNIKQKIQITHNPPFGTRIDIIQSGAHVGSVEVKNFIERHAPVVAISSHIHEARTTDKLKGTFLINSGKFSEGYFGLVNINENKISGRVLNLIE